MHRRQHARPPGPKLRHEDVAARIAEYHVGRLSPAMNAAIEAHVRECPICKRQGLDRAPMEKRSVERRVRRLKPEKRLISARGRVLILVLLLIIAVQVVVLFVTRGIAL